MLHLLQTFHQHAHLVTRVDTHRGGEVAAGNLAEVHEHLFQRARDRTRQHDVATGRQRQANGNDDAERPQQTIEEGLRSRVGGAGHLFLNRVQTVGLFCVRTVLAGNLVRHECAGSFLVATLEGLDGRGDAFLDQGALLARLTGHALFFRCGEWQREVTLPPLLACIKLFVDRADSLSRLARFSVENGTIQRGACLHQLGFRPAQHARGRQVIGEGFLERRVRAQVTDQPQRTNARQEYSQNKQHQRQPCLDGERFHIRR